MYQVALRKSACVSSYTTFRVQIILRLEQLNLVQMYESFFQKVRLQKTWIELYKNSLHPKVNILEDLRFTNA